MFDSIIHLIRLIARPSITYAWQVTPQSREPIISWLEENLDIINATLEYGDYVVVVRDNPSSPHVGDPFTILPGDIFHERYRFVYGEEPGYVGRVRPVR